MTLARVRRLAVALVAAAGLGALVWPSAAQAEPSLPWTPSALARHHLQLLADDAGLALPLMQWPLPAEAVAEALDRLPRALAPMHEAARAQVVRELNAANRAGLRATLRTSGDRLTGFGDDSARGSTLALRSDAVENRYVSAQLGGRVEAAAPERGAKVLVRPEGSAVVVDLRGVLLLAKSSRFWWGPGWQDSLVLGHAAPALTGLSLQRSAALPSESPWLSWLGPWNFEFFVAGLEGTRVPAHPFLVGNRLSVKPWSGLEIGFTRTAQWGGEGRNQSARSFADMLVGRNLNIDDPTTAYDDAANALAGFDQRLRSPCGVRCAGDTQLIGEDEAAGLPSKFLGLYGLEGWTGEGRHRWFAEVVESGCKMPVGRNPYLADCAYRNRSYPEGYTHRGRWLGAGVGPDSRVLTLGWLDAAQAWSMRLHYGRIGARIARTDIEARNAGRLHGATARRALQWRGVTVTPEVGWTRIAGDNDVRAGVTVELGLDAMR